MSLLWGIVVLVLADTAAIAAMLLVRRRAPEGSFFSDGDRASGVFGMLATGFAIFAGSVIFLAFTTYDQARAGAESEALIVVQQYQTAQFLAPATRDRLAGELVCYGRSVVNQEWPGMESGDLDDTINPSTLDAAPDDPLRRSSDGGAGDCLRQVARPDLGPRGGTRDRVHAALGITPTTIWIVLFLSAGDRVRLHVFFADPAELKRWQAMLIGSAATVVSAALPAIYALDKSYRPCAREHSAPLQWSAR